MWKSFIIAGAGVIFLISLWVVIDDGRMSDISPAYTAVSYEAIENWDKDQQSLAFAAFKESCEVLLKRPAKKIVPPQELGGRVEDWHQPCLVAEAMAEPTNTVARQFFEQHFSVVSYAPEEEGLFTGYFAPEYLGSDHPTEEYNVPLYAVPEDLKILDLGKFRKAWKGKTIIGQVQNGEFVPYKDRKIIDQGALEGQELELVWLKDPTDAFFLHIQGSGVVRYENGDRKTFGYAGKNGKAYHAIGKFLIESGDISREDMSMQAIRAWIEENPLQANSLMWKNPSYVFFRPLDDPTPIGAMGVELTAGRSLAVDRQFVPLGLPVWLDLKAATPESDPIRRLVIAQDTGGAIKGRVRGDVYWGIGADAGLMAGSMKDRGRYYFLVPHRVAESLLSRQDSRND